jgi:hypothetical protein
MCRDASGCSDAGELIVTARIFAHDARQHVAAMACRRPRGDHALARLETFENRELEQLRCTEGGFPDLLLA